LIFSNVNVISGLQGVFGTTFIVTGSYWKAGVSFLKRVTGRIFAITVVSFLMSQKKTET
jgi:hypothetical protein